METIEKKIEDAKNKLTLAENILNNNIAGDSKLLLCACENLFICCSLSITGLLQYDDMLKNTEEHLFDFDKRFKLFMQKCVSKYDILESDVSVIKELKDIIVSHGLSPVEFVRHDTFVICSDNYKMKIINKKLLKDMHFKVNDFVNRIDAIIKTTKKDLKEPNKIQI